ncbi:MAG: CrcB family protein [Haloferacaceae archaeon]
MRDPLPDRDRLLDVGVVAVGGFLGANGRYGVALIVPGTLEATLAVNVAGSFLLGVLVYGSVAAGGIPSRVRLLFGTGVLSSFTTYSTFAIDVATHPESAALYVLVSYGFGFGAVLLGRRTSNRAFPEERERKRKGSQVRQEEGKGNGGSVGGRSDVDGRGDVDGSDPGGSGADGRSDG